MTATAQTITIVTERHSLDTNNAVTDRDLDSFHVAVRNAIREKYPHSVIGTQEGLESRVIVDDEATDENADVAAIKRIIQTVYEAGNFWS